MNKEEEEEEEEECMNTNNTRVQGKIKPVYMGIMD